MENSIRVVVIDDHFVSLAGIVGLLSRNKRIHVAAEGYAGNHVLEMLEEHKPDVLITDLCMPAHSDAPNGAMLEPINMLQKVRRRYPDTAIIVISQEHDVYTIQSMAEIGIKGYFLKTDNFVYSLGNVVEQIQRGMIYFSPDVQEVIYTAPKITREIQLTPQQLNVLRTLVCAPGISRSEQAALLNISKSTLQKHINAIFDAMSVSNMESCILKAMRMRLVDVNDVIK